jgi:hypothetical protein
MTIPRARDLNGHVPARGWAAPGEIIHCDICGERCFVWQLHHLDPIGWGGSPSRRLDDHQVVWVVVDGRCHDAIHIILDHAKDQGGWPDVWLNQLGGVPHLVEQGARRGWALYTHRIRQET